MDFLSYKNECRQKYKQNKTKDFITYTNTCMYFQKIPEINYLYEPLKVL
jgi:hypothetical protein